MDSRNRSNLFKFLKGGALLGLSLLLLILTVRTMNLSRPRIPVQECKATDADFISLSEKRISNFQKALQFQTISWSPGNYNRENLFEFGNFIIKAFPNVHQSPYVEWERVNNYSLLYHVKGSNPELRPYLLMSHLDVVPVTNPEVWEAPAFSGQILDGFIYGRGTIDVKQSVMGIMEALDFLLPKRRPKRSFYVAFGHDEEVFGYDGAAFLSQRLTEKGVTELEYISDEGLPITQGIVVGVKRPVASIGVVEKGQLVLKLSVQSTPGHSSMPPKESTIGILARALHRLESNPLPSMLGDTVTKEMFEKFAPEVNVFQRMLFANIWLFKPLISMFMSLKPTTSAMIRTVTSVTMFNAGVKVNIIPSFAEAIVNHRIHPSQSVQEVVDYDRAIIGDDRVTFEVVNAFEAHPVAGFGETDFGFQVMKTSISQLWPDAITAPGIMVGNTDTKHFLHFTSNVYRFSPTHMLPGDPARFHGNNERISVKNYEQVINYYYHLIRNSDQPGVSPVHEAHTDF